MIRVYPYDGSRLVQIGDGAGKYLFFDQSDISDETKKVPEDVDLLEQIYLGLRKFNRGEYVENTSYVGREETERDKSLDELTLISQEMGLYN